MSDVGENDIVMDVDGYRLTCVVCGEIVTAGDGFETTVRTFSFGDGPETAFCTGVVFLCEHHIDHDQATWCLAQRIGRIAVEVA